MNYISAVESFMMKYKLISVHHCFKERMLTDSDLDLLLSSICWAIVFSQSNFVMGVRRWSIIGCKSGLNCVILQKYDVGGYFVHSSSHAEDVNNTDWKSQIHVL